MVWYHRAGVECWTQGLMSRIFLAPATHVQIGRVSSWNHTGSTLPICRTKRMSSVQLFSRCSQCGCQCRIRTLIDPSGHMQGKEGAKCTDEGGRNSVSYNLFRTPSF
jgi:hypothetical protein